MTTAETSSQTASGGWGPLAEPLRTAIAEGAPPWRDNAYLAFWSTDLDVYGCYHASTSPNAEGRRARFSLAAMGASAEVVEEVDPGTLSSASISFDLDDLIEVESDRVSGSLRMEPLFALADYSNRIIPTVEAGTPLTHFQRAAAIAGDFTLDGREIQFEGVGLRDRTWGSRDESASIDEHIGVMAVFSDCALTIIRMRGTTGSDLTEGFVLHETEAAPITAIDEIVRDASGLFLECEVRTESGDRLALRNVGRAGGFWVPVGSPRKGNVLSVYDEFDHLEAGVLGTGAGMVEQGRLRTL